MAAQVDVVSAAQRAKELIRAEPAAHRGAVVIMDRSDRVAQFAFGEYGASRTEWTVNTLTEVASVSKALTSAVALEVARESGFGLDRPVVDVWPELAGSGRERISLRVLLSQQAGLVGIRAPYLPPDVLLCWGEMVGWLERETPWWVPGTSHGYHAMTYGFLVGEWIRRLTGAADPSSAFTAFLHRHALSDLYVGLPDSEADRVADLGRPAHEPDQFPPIGSRAQQINNPPDPGLLFRNSKQWREAFIPSVNVHASASGLAGLASLILESVSHGDEPSLAAATPQSSGPDWFGRESTFTAGFASPERGIIGWPGGTGCCLWVDAENGFTVVVVQAPSTTASADPSIGWRLVCALRSTAPTPPP